MLTLWDDIRSWLYTPFKDRLDPVNWVLIVILTMTVAFAWSRILDKVLEE